MFTQDCLPKTLNSYFSVYIGTMVFLMHFTYSAEQQVCDEIDLLPVNSAQCFEFLDSSLWPDNLTFNSACYLPQVKGEQEISLRYQLAMCP